MNFFVANYEYYHIQLLDFTINQLTSLIIENGRKVKCTC